MFATAFNRLKNTMGGKKMQRLFTTAEAAERLGLKYQALYRYIYRYGLGNKQGRDVWLDQKDLDFIATRIGKRGQPGHNQGVME